MEGLAELHTHLGGSVASDTMWSLAHEQGIALPVKDYWEFDRLVTVSDPRGVANLDALDAIYHWTELIQSSPLAVERSGLVSSGTEAGMTAIRIARAATRRRKIMKFDGCYHGHSDGLLVRAGSGGMTLGIPDSAGVPEPLAAMTIVARYNSIESVARCFEEHRGEIAA